MFKREYFFQSPVVDDLRNQVKHEGHNQQTAQPAQAADILPFEYLRFVDAQNQHDKDNKCGDGEQCIHERTGTADNQITVVHLFSGAYRHLRIHDGHFLIVTGIDDRIRLDHGDRRYDIHKTEIACKHRSVTCFRFLVLFFGQTHSGFHACSELVSCGIQRKSQNYEYQYAENIQTFFHRCYFFSP